MQEAEADLQTELERVKVSVTYINSNLWYYQMLFFLACCRVISMKLSAGPLLL